MEPEVLTPPIVDLPTEPQTELPKRRRWLRFLTWFVVIKLTTITIAIAILYLLYQPPADFEPQTFTIEPGESLLSIAHQLAQQQIVQSELMLFTILRFWQDPTQIKAATYTFDEPHTALEVAQLLVEGEFGNDLTSLTFIEGMRVQEFAWTASELLPNVTEVDFLEQATGLEGTLFPETYFVPADFTTADLIELMATTHTQRVDELLGDTINTLSTDDIVILASIVEREANTPQSKGLVAGVFMNRLAIGMPLQADASIEYVINTPLGELPPGQLAAELRELDSPYNTYLYSGLPPTPIGNPGAVALAAVISPTPSDYFYYITGNDGEFYYAETYNAHLNNIERHLR